MKRLQRRTKHQASKSGASNSDIGMSSARMSRINHELSLRWQALSPRDQLALAVLFVFLLLFIGGYGGYSVHQAANDSKRNYQAQVADYFWLRSQAASIDSKALNATDSQANVSPTNRINSILNGSGITNAQVVATGDAVQLSFNNDSQAVISTALGKLKQQGWQFSQLLMQQNQTDKSIQVQATVTL